MKLTKMIALAVAWVLLSQTSQPLLAQAQQQTKRVQERSPEPKFVELDKGVSVFRLFQRKDHPKGAEVAILRLSKDQYRKFQQDPKKFVNETYKNKIFLFQVTDVVSATYQGMKPLGDDAKGDVQLVMHHDPSWTVGYLAVERP